MMEICNSSHDEIVFDTRWCPLCQANEEIRELEVQCEQLEERCGELEAEKDKLEETIDDLKPLVPEYFI